MKQWHCSIGGQQFGPAAEDVLQGWVREGRLKATDHVWSEGMPNWVPAGTALPQLFAGAPAAPAGGPMAGPVAGPTPYATPGAYPGSGLKPHRGGMILTFGILGLALDLFCCLFVILASSRG